MSLGLVVLEPGARSLDEIADSIRAHWKATEDDRFAIGRDLLEAREHFGGDREFGQWWESQGFPFTQQWGRTLRLAAANEPAVRDALQTQVCSGKPSNFKKAVEAVVRAAVAAPDVDAVDEEGRIGDGPWSDVQNAMSVWASLLSSHNATRIAQAVPPRRRAATARRLRAIGTDLGRVALVLERMNAK